MTLLEKALALAKHAEDPKVEATKKSLDLRQKAGMALVNADLQGKVPPLLSGVHQKAVRALDAGVRRSKRALRQMDAALDEKNRAITREPDVGEGKRILSLAPSGAFRPASLPVPK
jgi:hypothetical protein